MRCGQMTAVTFAALWRERKGTCPAGRGSNGCLLSRPWVLDARVDGGARARGTWRGGIRAVGWLWIAAPWDRRAPPGSRLNGREDRRGYLPCGLGPTRLPQETRAGRVYPTAFQAPGQSRGPGKRASQAQLTDAPQHPLPGRLDSRRARSNGGRRAVRSGWCFRR
jgi:hypothetical protein